MSDLAVFYEHPSWFRPLFAALERRGVDWRGIEAADHVFDPGERRAPAPVIFNRVAMSSFLRQSEHPIFYAAALFDHWERNGARVINGPAALAVDTSKARQISLIAGLGLSVPATRVAHRREDLAKASEGMGFPLLAKPNIGGSGAGVTRYDDPAALQAAATAGTTPVGIDGVTLLQDYVPARGGRIYRAETLNGALLYTIALKTDGATFDLCPADVCLAEAATPVAVEAVEIDAATKANVERLFRAARIDVGGVEFMIDDRDGRTVFYDINALSNFVADPMKVLGWDPHDRLVDFLIDTIAAKRKAAA